MFSQKAGKHEEPDKGPYTYHPIIEHCGKTRYWNEGFVRVISIDPGEKRLAILCYKHGYDGVSVETELFELLDLSQYSTAYTNSDTSYIYSYLMNKLDQYKT